YRNLSQTMRALMGLPLNREEESFAGADDIEGVEHLAKLVLAMVDRLDDLTKVTTKIARHVGVPLEGGFLRAAMLGDPEREGPALDHDRPLDAPLSAEFIPRGGHRHPPLPAGFSR